MSGRSRRGTQRGRGRRGRSRRNIIRLAHRINTVERHGGSLPVRQVAFPPPKPPSQNFFNITVRYEHAINLETGKTDDTFVNISKLAAASKKDPYITLFSLFMYYRCKYADVWFVPRHAPNTSGDYTMHLVQTPYASHGAFDPTDTDAFDVSMNATGTSYRRAYQVAKLRYVPLNEREADYRLNPTASQAGSSYGDDLFHIIIMNNNLGVKDPNGASTTNTNLMGRVVIDAHFTLKGARLSTPEIPKVDVGLPILSEDQRFIFIHGVRKLFTPDNFATIMANMPGDGPINAWYDRLTRSVRTIASAVNSGFEMVSQSQKELLAALQAIYRRIPVCPPPGGVDAIGESPAEMSTQSSPFSDFNIL